MGRQLNSDGSDSIARVGRKRRGAGIFSLDSVPVEIARVADDGALLVGRRHECRRPWRRASGVLPGVEAATDLREQPTLGSVIPKPTNVP